MQLKRLLKEFYPAFVIIVACLLSPYLIPLRVNRTEGISMWPTIKDGNTVLVLTAFNPEHLANGTIIVYRVNETYYVEHRIIEVHDGYYICKGDNNAEADMWPVRPSSVYAVFIAVLW